MPRRLYNNHSRGQVAIIALSAVAAAAVSTCVLLLVIRQPAGSISGAQAAAAKISSYESEDIEAAEEEELLTPAEIERRIGEIIDDLGGHPDDRQLPQDVLGASDDVVAAMVPLDVKMLLEDKDVKEFLKRHKSEPRYAFAVGRLAMFHGYTSKAEELLKQAADAGSGAACAYLADPIFTADDTEAVNLLKRAVELNFTPASDLLAEIEYEGSDNSLGVPPFRFADFSQPEIIQAFYEGRAPSGDSELETWGYISSFLNSISDSSNLFMVENPRSFYLELSPSLQVIAEFKMMTSAKLLEESMTMTVQQFLGAIQGGQSGGSLTDKVANMSRGMIAPQFKLIMAKLSGEHDGKRLALSYDIHPEAFRKIYAGVKKHVESQQ